MGFPLDLYLWALAGGVGCSAATLPLWRRWCLHTGHVDDPGHRKIHDQPVPLAGGLAVFTGLLVPLAAVTAVWLAGPSGPVVGPALAYGLRRRLVPLVVLLGGALGMVLLGWLDDRHELRPHTKFAGQCLVALGVAAAGVRLTLFVENPVFSYLVTVLWILTVTNACNFMDNMNGLCAGLGVIGTWCFAWSGAVQGQFLAAALAFLACGALAGFLPHNFPRARAFLGDAGSHLTGYLLAVMAILPDFYSPQTPQVLAVLKPLLILGVLLGDLGWVVVLRWRMGRPVYVGDTNHLSHRLVRRGLSRTTAVLLIWLLAALLGSLAFVL